jgi:hypothetical protein
MDFPNINGMELEQLVELQKRVMAAIQSKNTSSPSEKISAKLKKLGPFAPKLIGTYSVLFENNVYHVQITPLLNLCLYVTAEIEERYYVSIDLAGFDEEVVQSWYTPDAQVAAFWFKEIGKAIADANFVMTRDS